MYNTRGWHPLQPQSPQGLPPGWEAKWDPNSNRWFYVNHATKTTQWEKPQNVTQAHHPATTTSFIEADPTKVKSLVKEFENVSDVLARNLLLTHNNDISAVRNALTSRGYPMKKIVEPKLHFLNSLKSQYPTAPEEVIKEILISTSNNFGGTKLSLESMGFKKENEYKPVAKKATPASSKPAAATFAKTNKKTSAPTVVSPAKLTDAEKRKRHQELKQKFPSVNDNLIKLSLEGTKYNLVLATSVLQSSVDSVNTTLKKIPTSSATDTTTAFKPASLAPVVFGEEERRETKPTTSSTPSSMPQPPRPTTSTSSVTAQRKREIYTKYYTKKVAPARRQPPPGTYTSALRMTPVGPNPSLCNGPNLSLLIDKRIQTMGPNRANRMGPQASNRCGPQPSHCRGSAGIAVGPKLSCRIGTAV